MTTRKGHGREGLSGEDAELWELVKARFEPLQRGRDRVVSAEDRPGAEPRVQVPAANQKMPKPGQSPPPLTQS